MAEYAKLPKIGLTMKTGTITNLMKNVGDVVKKGDVVATFETDKISGDIESPIDGTILEVLIHADEEIEVLEPIYLIGIPGEVAEPTDDTHIEQAETTEAMASPVEETEAIEAVTNGDWVKAMPIARSMAKKNGLDLRTVKPSSKDGILHEKDIEDALLNKKQATSLAHKTAELHDVDLRSISGTGTRGKIVQADVLNALPTLAAAAPPVPAAPAARTFAGIASRNKLSGMRKGIAERLSLSKQTIPHTYFKAEIDATSLIALKDTLKAEHAEGKIRKVTVNDILLKTVVATLKKYPIMYAQLDQDEIVYFENIQLGVAVSLDNGLIVPVIHGADQCSLTELSAKTAELVEKARTGKLSMEEYTGGNFTVSNLGSSEMDEFYAIINPPEAAILAISAIKEKVIVKNSEMVICPMMTVTLSVDHRIIDGAVAAAFMKDLKNSMQNAYLSML